MSKWALWAAHRYLHPGAAVPRRVGPDGRELRRPWRQVRPEVRSVVQRERAARSQPWWPRPLGVLLLGMACLYAIEPVGPVPTDVAASSSARTGPRLQLPTAKSPDGNAGSAAPFAWTAGDASGPFTIVVLTAGYDELFARDGIAGSPWTPDAAAAAAVSTPGTYHWFVRGEAFGRTVTSPLASFEIR
jgi:hypothetical protein